MQDIYIDWQLVSGLCQNKKITAKYWKNAEVHPVYCLLLLRLCYLAYCAHFRPYTGFLFPQFYTYCQELNVGTVL